MFEEDYIQRRMMGSQISDALMKKYGAGITYSSDEEDDAGASGWNARTGRRFWGNNNHSKHLWNRIGYAGRAPPAWFNQNEYRSNASRRA